jgi:hypothetical protein
VEVIGDRWSLLVLRDVMFGNRRYFRVLQERSEEGIASNISVRERIARHGDRWRDTVLFERRSRVIS